MVSRKTIIIFGELLIFVTVTFVVYSIFGSYQKGAHIEANWKNGTATILESKVRIEQGRVGESADSYALELRYAYLYAGKSFEGNCTCFRTYSPSEMNYDAFRAGNQMEILINPSNPSETEVRHNIQTSKKLAFILVLSLIGLFLVSFLEWTRRSIKD